MKARFFNLKNAPAYKEISIKFFSFPALRITIKLYFIAIVFDFNIYYKFL